MWSHDEGRHLSGEGEDEHHHVAHPGAPLIVLVLALAVGVVSKAWLGKLKVPYTALLFVSGIGLSAIVDGSTKRPLARSVGAWENVNPHLIFLVFLPILIFESAFCIDFHVLYRQAKQVLFLAVPGVALATTLTASIVLLIFPDSHLSWSSALLLGAVLSATDPVAVVALMKDLGVSKRLGTLLEGESLLNDGTSIVIFNVFFRALSENGEHRVNDDDDDTNVKSSLTAGAVSTYFLRLSLGGPLLGVAIGHLTTRALGLIYHDAHAEITLTVVAALGTFFIAETLTVEGQQLTSGVLAVVALGLMVGTRGKSRVSTSVGHELHSVWAMLGFVANTAIFFVSGLIVFDRLRDRVWRDLGRLLLLYVGIHVARGLVLLLAWPTLQRTGYGLPFSHLLALWWGGLRGAVGLTLSLVVEEEPRIHKDVRDVVVFAVAGITFLTLLVNGTTMEFVLGALGLSQSDESAQLELQNIAAHISASTDRFVEQIALDDKFLHDARWGLVFKYLPVHDPKTYAIRCRKMRGAHARIMTSRWRRYGQKFNASQERRVVGRRASMRSASFAYIVSSTAGQAGAPSSSPAPSARVSPIPAPEGEEENMTLLDDTKRLMWGNLSGFHQTDELGDERLTEQRRRAVLMIKSALWHFLEEGYVRPSTMDSLLDAADVTLDRVTAGEPMECWTRQLLPILEQYSATLDMFAAVARSDDDDDNDDEDSNKKNLWRRMSRAVRFGSTVITNMSTRTLGTMETQKKGWWLSLVEFATRVPLYRLWLRWKVAFLFEVASNYARTCARVASDLRIAKCSQQLLHELENEASLAEKWIDDKLEARVFLTGMTRSLKTEIAARVSLIFEQSTVSSLHKAGRLDEREIAALQNPVTVSIQQLDFHPKALEPPSALRQLLSIPALADLDNEDDDALVRLADSAKEINLDRDEDVASTGCLASAWYLVSSGTVFSNQALAAYAACGGACRGGFGAGGPSSPSAGAPKSSVRRGSFQPQFTQSSGLTYYGTGEPIGLLDCVSARRRLSSVSIESGSARLLKFDFAETLRIVKDRPLVIHALLAAAAIPVALRLSEFKDAAGADLRRLLCRGVPRVEPAKDAPNTLAPEVEEDIAGCSHLLVLVGSCVLKSGDDEDEEEEVTEKVLAPYCLPLDPATGEPPDKQILLFSHGTVAIYLREADFDAFKSSSSKAGTETPTEGSS